MNVSALAARVTSAARYLQPRRSAILKRATRAKTAENRFAHVTPKSHVGIGATEKDAIALGVWSSSISDTTFPGKSDRQRAEHDLARLSADAYKAGGKSFAATMRTAKLMVDLMEKYGTNWPESAEWKAYKAIGRA